MAVGDDARAAGYPLVPNTGLEGLVRYGAREINRTRDLVAVLSGRVPNILPVNRGGTGGSSKTVAKRNLGLNYGSSLPSSGDVGDVFFKI